MISNRPDELNEMMADLAAYGGPLGPGPYWLKNQSATLRWLRDNDLNHFRRYDPVGKGLSNFGGVSYWRSHSELIGEQQAIASGVLHRLAQKLRISPLRQYFARQLRRNNAEILVRKLAMNSLVDLCRARDTAGQLSKVEATIVGSPSDVIEFDGRHYTPAFLVQFLRYLEMKEKIDFSSVANYVEIGPGVGAFAEVLAKVEPSVRIHLIDIPPQLYVLQQVLDSIFPGEVAGYSEIKANPSVLTSRTKRIFALAPWQTSLMDGLRMDLAYNRTLEEMSPAAIEGYLRLFDGWKTKTIHLRTLDVPKHAGAMMADDYAKLLPNYDLLARVPIVGSFSPHAADSTEKYPSGRPASGLYFTRARNV